MYDEIRNRVRRSLRDEYGLLWSDTELDEMIDEAQREYALYSGALTGSFELISSGAIMAMPADFIAPLRCFDPDGIELPIVSWKMLHARHADFRSITGTRCESICFDFYGFGRFRIFPLVPDGTACGRILYSRLPAAGTIEVRDQDALESHVLFQASMFSDLGSAGKYWDDFIKSATAVRGGNLTTNNKPKARRGRFF